MLRFFFLLKSFFLRKDSSVIDYNKPPRDQPSLWCHWSPTRDGLGLEWNGSEKFYEYVEWLEYMIKNFFNPWGLDLNGTVKFQGERGYDFGAIIITNNEVVVSNDKQYKVRETNDDDHFPIILQ